MKYADLSAKRKEQEYEKWVRSQCDDDWYEPTIDFEKDRAKERGFFIDKINFSGFWSQGDGAQWEGVINLRQFVDWDREQEKQVLTPRQHNLSTVLYEGMTIPVSVVRATYCHSRYMGFENWQLRELTEICPIIDSGPLAGIDRDVAIALWEEVVCDVEKRLLEAARDYADEVYEALEEEYEYLTSKEYFEEFLDSNDVEFDEEEECYG